MAIALLKPTLFRYVLTFFDTVLWSPYSKGIITLIAKTTKCLFFAFKLNSLNTVIIFFVFNYFPVWKDPKKSASTAHL